MKDWGQLFRSHTERLWFQPPPMNVVEKNRDRFDQFGQPTSLKEPKEEEAKRRKKHQGRDHRKHHNDHHGNKHRGKH